ncbi:MAG: hypothetical protein CVU41_15650 [Chloroflexi bacterium HGW-Chloroflexi-3]|nr:MAG: hypothetical protein CVU41_15650 [Chloroflexi bacterium HGW-Chloroflexi-3]
MDHQPFEEWIFEQKERTKEDSIKLKQHLLDCDQCNDLQSTWDQVEMLLFQTHMVAPAHGFTQRFAARMEMNKEVLHKKQAIKILIGIGFILIIITLILGAIFFLSYSTGELIVGAVSTFTGFVQAYINLRFMVYQFFHNLPPIAIIFGWIILIVWGIILTPLWGFTVWKVSKQGVLIK